MDKNQSCLPHPPKEKQPAKKRQTRSRDNAASKAVPMISDADTLPLACSTQNSETTIPKRRGRKTTIPKRRGRKTTTVPTPSAAEPTTLEVALSILNTTGNTRRRGRPPKQANRTQIETAVLGDTSMSRGQAIATIAASAPVIDFIDLVTSPIVPINEVVVVDSDLEDEKTSSTTHLSESFDINEDNPEMSVKIKWNGNAEVFPLRKYQKFAELYKRIAERENIDEKQIVLNLNNKIIVPDETPASINYKIYQFINGRVLQKQATSHIPMASKKVSKADELMLKIQSDKWKHPLQLSLSKTEKIKVLYIKCAEELNMPYTGFVLKFNGDTLNFDETPNDLELEGDEAIDLFVRK